MAEKATIARPYARAAFAYARQGNALTTWSEALTSAGAVVADARVKKLIGNPKVAPKQLLDFVTDVIGGKVDANIRNFFDEMVRNRRLALLPQVAAMFEAMRNELENIADVQVTSAVALNETQRQRLADALKKRLKKDVRLHCSVDANLIAGAVIRSGDMVIDGSMRTRLEGLAGAMSH